MSEALGDRLDNPHRRSAARLLAGLGAAALLAGCGGSIAIVHKFPVPVIEPLPLNVGVYYEDDIRFFQFLDKTSDGATWSVDFGDANIRMLDNVFGAMFTSATEVGDPSLLTEPVAGLDGIVAPKIEEFAFLTPAEQGSKFFAVSIRYRLDVHQPDGTLASSWQVNAYGKSRSQLLQGEESLAEATRFAMRDAAAALAEQYKDKPELAVLFPNEEPTDASDPKPEAIDAEPDVDAGGNAAGP
ncbi:MAG: hypothetical protein AAGD86_04150 [Pseudomonadota bacterium]